MRTQIKVMQYALSGMGVITISTIESHIQKHGNTKLPQFAAAFIGSISALTIGIVAGWLSPSLPLLQSSEPAVGEVPITNEEASWLGSLVFLGALAASPVFSYICQNFGRKAAGYITVLPLIVCWIITILSNSITTLYVARFLGGVTCGGVTVFFPTYLGEIAQDDIRGRIGVFFPCMSNAGILFVYAVGPFVSFKVLAIICLTIPFIFLLGYYRLPESPVFLLTKGKVQEAARSLLWLRGGNRKIAEEDLKKLTDLVEGFLESSGVKKSDLLLSRGTRKAMLICFVTLVSQHLSGTYAIINYCNDILQISGSGIPSDIATICVGVLQIFGSFLSSIFVEILGRRILLIGSQLLMIVCLGTLGTYMYFLQQGVDLSAVSLIPVACLSLYLFSVAVGLGPVTFVLISEIFHPHIKGIAMTVATSTIWIFAFLVTKFYPLLTDLMGIHTLYWVFACVCFMCTVFSVFQIPETKNRSVESILRELNGEIQIEEANKNSEM